ncbi:Hydrolase [Lachnellula subtilissima]|uniref:Hydrolase n=1 Tax=Lachnellula subtilissima TaxID=602034 RepID=A0A8H8RHS5_9HELO|nr:Hydrolase [Lachnellula subtilissima]
MADPEVSTIATKAPESDAAEDVQKDTPPSLVAGDTPAQTGASLGEHCVTDRPTPSGLGSSGEITSLAGIDTYISKPADYPHAPSKLLLLLTAATGLHSVNNQIQADNYAKEGFLVVMPDMFAGDPLPGSATYTEEKDPSIIEQVKMRAAETAKSFLIDLWLARNTPQKALPIVHKVLEAAKDEYADAVANGGGVYSVGYCFGGSITLLLAGEKPDTVVWGQQQPTDEEAGVVKKGPFIKAGAIAHPTSITREDFEGTKAPLAFICVENDQLFSDEIREYGEKYLKENNVESEFRTYSGVPHGFAVTGDYPDDASIQPRQTEAFGQMLAWLKSH